VVNFLHKYYILIGRLGGKKKKNDKSINKIVKTKNYKFLFLK
jgi:hypothetical protein